MKAGAEAIAKGYRLRVLERTRSTNDDALAALREGDPGRLWIVARSQEGGRGRHGRPWTSPAGNLYASLLLVAPCTMRHAAQLGFVVALALRDAIVAIAPEAATRLRLKWPNDLLLDGAKLSGILLEGHGRPDGSFAVIVGIGVNIAHRPHDTPYPAARLADLAVNVTPETLFAALSDAMARRLSRLQTAGPESGFAACRAEWLMHAAGIGETVTVRLPAGPRSGSFAGLDADGRLRLNTGAETLSIDAGDLFFGDLAAREPSKPSEEQT